MTYGNTLALHVIDPDKTTKLTTRGCRFQSLLSQFVYHSSEVLLYLKDSNNDVFEKNISVTYVSQAVCET